MQSSDKLQSEKIGSLVLKMSVPIMFSMAVLALYNVVDSIFLSHYSNYSLSALSLAFPIQLASTAVFIGTGVGINSLVSRTLGKGDNSRASEIALIGFFLELVSSLIFVVFGFFFSYHFAKNFSNDINIVNATTSYLTVCMGFCTPVALSVTSERLMQAEGDSFHPMIVQIIGAVTNIILDPLLIFGIGPFPRLGVMGAAVATVFGECLACVFAYYFYCSRKDSVLKARIRHLIKIKLDKSIIKDIYAVGVPSIILQGLNSVSTLFINIILKGYTADATAIFGLYFKVQSFLYMPIFGLNSGLIPIIGYNFGAKNKERVYKALKTGCLIALGIMIFGTLLFQVLPNLIMSPFNLNENMKSIAFLALRIISLGFIFSAVAIVLNAFFMGIGSGIKAMIINLARQIILLVPSAFIFSYLIGLHGVWMAFPFAEVFALIIAVALFIRQKNKLERIGYWKQEKN